MFLRLSESDFSKFLVSLDETEPCRHLIIKVLGEIKALVERCERNDQYNVYKLKEAVKLFSAHFHVFLEKESDNNFYINLPKDPKEYFVGEVVETEPRIVCFMDILGFSDLISDYESDITSTVLQDIQESFALAKTQLLEIAASNNKDFFKHLSYQTFSDNICISIPYFDNEQDFLTNFNLISIYVRGFQLIMFSKGLFMRGGISTGSYYADDNIIFSLGLVKAYHLESKKAIYPRVVIDNSIIDKLISYDPSKVIGLGLDKSIVFDWENIPFLNPFGLVDSSIQMFKSSLEDIDQDEDEDPFIDVIKSFTKSLGGMTINLLNGAAQKERGELEKVKNLIAENVIRNKKNDRVLSKYVWLIEFIKWYEGSEKCNLQFQKLEKILKKNDL